MSKFTSARPVHNMHVGWHFFRNRRTLWQMIREVLGGRYRMSWSTMAIVIIAVAYIVYPYDLLPDNIPVLGWLDDAVVFCVLIWRLVYETHRYNRFKAMERKHTGQSPYKE